MHSTTSLTRLTSDFLTASRDFSHSAFGTICTLRQLVCGLLFDHKPHFDLSESNAAQQVRKLVRGLRSQVECLKASIQQQIAASAGYGGIWREWNFLLFLSASRGQEHRLPTCGNLYTLPASVERPNRPPTDDKKTPNNFAIT